MTRSNFNCSLYPKLSNLSDGALAHARCIIQDRVKWDSDHPLFEGSYSKEDYIEAMAMIILEEEYRWDNGGKQAFDKMIQNTFGRPATSS